MNVRDLGQLLDQYENTPDSYGIGLRLDLSEIVLRHLKNNMTQASLARESGLSPQMVTRIVHAATNCTFETAGKVLFALGIKAQLVESQSGAIFTKEPEIRITKKTDTKPVPSKILTYGNTK